MAESPSTADVPTVASPVAAPSSRPWQFGLRTLLLAMVVCGLVFATISAATPLTSLVLLWFGILVLAHVAANAWGSKVPSSREARPAVDSAAPAQPSRAAVQASVGKTTRLREQVSVRRTMIVAGAIGGVLGGVGGASALVASGIGSAQWAGLIVGTLSSCVIGGLLGFLTSTFVQITGGALREAAAVAPRDTRPPAD